MRQLTRVATRPTIALVLALLSIPPVTAQKKPVRVAVIIGNGAYPNPAHLTNPPNDATSMKRALEMLGFQVYLKLNASKDDMVNLGQDAKRWFAGSDVGLFFYAGHGLQINNENFIVPVDASFAKTKDISTELFSLSETLEWMDEHASTNLIFLDACRKNPFTDVIKNQVTAGREITIGDANLVKNVGLGLAEMKAGARTLIAYATQPGDIAADGQGSNSPFTTGILRHIRERGTEIRTFLTFVRVFVMKDTNGRQITWDHSSWSATSTSSHQVRARDIPLPPP